jgi:hypothetical protein
VLSVRFELNFYVSLRPLTVKARVRSPVSPCEICGGHSGTVTGFSPITSVFPVSIIPPMLHTHSYICHQRCIMFLSQYFSFPCQYRSTNAPYSYLSTCCSYQNDKSQSLETFQTAKLFPKPGSLLQKRTAIFLTAHQLAVISEHCQSDSPPTCCH